MDASELLQTVYVVFAFTVEAQLIAKFTASCGRSQPSIGTLLA